MKMTTGLSVVFYVLLVLLSRILILRWSTCYENGCGFATSPEQGRKVRRPSQHSLPWSVLSSLLCDLFCGQRKMVDVICCD